MAAGSQPMSVSCKIKQKTPAKGRPMVKKAKKGKKIARSNRMGSECSDRLFGQWMSNITTAGHLIREGLGVKACRYTLVVVPGASAASDATAPLR